MGTIVMMVWVPLGGGVDTMDRVVWVPLGGGVGAIDLRVLWVPGHDISADGVSRSLATGASQQTRFHGRHE